MPSRPYPPIRSPSGYYKENGIAPLTIFTSRVLLFTVPVPVTVTVFSVAIVMWQLWRMDPVSIIERRD